MVVIPTITLERGSQKYAQKHMAAQQHQTTQQLLGIGVNIRSAFTDCNAEARLALKRHGVNIRSAFTDHDKKIKKTKNTLQ